MKEINIAKVLINKRHEKGITQEELANFIGVSKASVSKWETEQSYPDVTFLPQLATFFDISLDELMDYKPQMSKEDIRKTYTRFSEDFATKPFDEVIAECRTTIKKYYSCYPLLLQMGILMLNHIELLKKPEESIAILFEVKEIFRRVRLEGENMELKRQAMYMEALCCLSSGNANGALELTGDKVTILLPPEMLIASAYRIKGKNEDAKAILQAGIFQNLVIIFNFFSSYLLLSADNPSKFEETLRRALDITETFDLKRLHPALIMSFLVTAAHGYMSMGNKEKALEVLERYTELATSDIYPLKLKGDSYFDLLDKWLDELDLGTNLPRSEKTIRKSMADAVIKNPLFSGLEGIPRYTNLIEKLQGNC